MCLNYRKNPRKEFLLSMQYKYQTIGVSFLYGPILPQRSHFIFGLWWITGPTLSRYRPNRQTMAYGVMMSRWIFSVLFELIIVNWNPSHRWFSEVAPVSWHINFISKELWLRRKSKVCNFWLFFTPLDYIVLAMVFSISVLYL